MTGLQWRCVVAPVRRSVSVFVGVLLWFTPLAVAKSQAPNEKWRTIDTPHFYVHFPAALESVARRAGGSAERAYAKLAPLLKAPRGRIDLVVTDHVDYSNGYAYVSPSPRVVIFARPPVDDRTLRFRDDWLDLVVQHELVHIFQLDRTRGWWRAAQAVFGRQPLLFPNAWAPSWMLEGLAVYYESKLGDGGRLEGKAHEAYVTADAVDSVMPRFGAWSASTLDFPGGSNAYIYGSLFVQSLSGRGGAGSVERFVESASGRLLPWTFEHSAKKAFGTSFADQWVRWRDSVVKNVGTAPQHRSLTSGRWLVRYPRLAPDGRLLYVAADGRDVTGLYELPAGLNGTPTRIARRNGMEPNVALADGRVVFAQTEWQDPWRLRSDLWVRERDGSEHALTHGARLFQPDVAPRSAEITAVQNWLGTTRLVRVDAQGVVSPITGATPDIETNWSSPRWSPDGMTLAATRWTRGGTMSIVTFVNGHGAARELVAVRGVIDAPSWSADSRTIYFSANVDGTTRLWSVDVASKALRVANNGPTSFDQPLMTPAGLVAVETRSGGERLVVSDAPSTTATLSGIADATQEGAPAPVTGAVTNYHAFRQLLPRYWLPEIETTDENNTRWGATITGNDVVGRHFYAATLTHEPTRGENAGSIIYRYSGFGLPFVDLAARQTWDHTPLADSTNKFIGSLLRRRRFVGTALTVVRQRVRNVATLTGAAELELRDFTTDPAPLLGSLGSPLLLKTLKYPTFTVAGSWGNTRTPIMAISPEDGIVLSGSARLRWRTDDASATRSTSYVAGANLFKSLGFIAGPAHHVLALRGVVGVTDDKTNTEFQAGGVSGSQVELTPGVVVGDVRRNFAVRGFTPGAQRGIRALGGSAEYRAPLGTPSWGKGTIPFFAQRVSATLFADAGAAWCPAGSAQGIGCINGPTPREWMASVGGELSLDAAVLNYDSPYHMRLGVARPVSGTAYAEKSSGSVYFSFGASF